jgi:hypothetical protein
MVGVRGFEPPASTDCVQSYFRSRLAIKADCDSHEERDGGNRVEYHQQSHEIIEPMMGEFRHGGATLQRA